MPPTVECLGNLISLKKQRLQTQDNKTRKKALEMDLDHARCQDSYFRKDELICHFI